MPAGDDGGENVVLFAPTHSNRRKDPAVITKAIQLRLAGLPWERIATECGYPSGDTARVSINAAMERVATEHATALRSLENARLDRQLQAIWPQVIAGDLGAGTLALRIAERRARLLGLDSPVKVEVSESTRAEIENLLSELTVIEGQVIHDAGG